MNKSVTLLRTAVFARMARRSKAYTGPLKASMNDLPQPCGSWKTNYDAKQRKYNAHLVMGVGIFIATLVIGKASGAFYLNFYPPEVPADSNDYGTED